jgi:hypothetical protein
MNVASLGICVFANTVFLWILEMTNGIPFCCQLVRLQVSSEGCKSYDKELVEVLMFG